MQQVEIGKRDPRQFTEVIGSPRTAELIALGESTRSLLDGRAVINVNSTAAGGGVAEMLHVLLGYVSAIGVDVRWLVIGGRPDFFAVTKRVHNHLYGSEGDGGPLGAAEHDIYRRALEPEANDLARRARPGDVVVLHDPQTAGLAEAASRLGCRVVWRCHVGIDEHNEHSDAAWDFLRAYLEPFVDQYVFTDRRFPPSWVPENQLTVIWPSIDPFSPKNQELAPGRASSILAHVGILAGTARDTSFRRGDGSKGRVQRYCDVFRTGPPATPDIPMILQVSRWDTMKDMVGVMLAFRDLLEAGHEAELVLAGPVVTAVADDPEGGEVLRSSWETWRQLPHRVRRRVQLVCLPMEDLEENAVIVNALQRHAAIVTQKSLAEGFGLTIAEAMLKRKAVVGSAVGGIVDQIIDNETGLLVRDPYDLAEFTSALDRLLGDDELRDQLGRQAQRRATDLHLGDTHLHKWSQVMAKVTRQ